MIQYRDENDKFQYILIAIDILSRFAWTRAITNKTGKNIETALKSIFHERRKSSAIRTERGSKFKNKIVQKFLRDEDIHHFVTYNEVKANYVERLNRTLKVRISRYFSHKQTHKWIDVLSDITHSYNNTFHRSIKRNSQSVNKENASDVWMTQYGQSNNKTQNKFTLEQQA